MPRSRLAVSLGTLLWVSLLGQGLERRDPEGPASLSHAVVLWFYGWTEEVGLEQVSSSMM